MGKKISTYYSDDNRGYCEIHIDLKHEMFYIKYFDSNNKLFYVEEFPNKSLAAVENIAEEWALGITKLEAEYH